MRHVNVCSDGWVAAVKLEDRSSIGIDMVVIGIGAKSIVSLFDLVGINNTSGGIQVLALDGFSMCSCRPLVSRARAMMWSDILATGKPCIMIPSLDMAEGHQFYNACLMADSRVMTKN
ncbi:Monodehydroascorbate reductase, chloroplastic [Capsicum chinense]|nr:Monodehydroascorbate reductase, chloroplastic [Capsicum chinense]